MIKTDLPKLRQSIRAQLQGAARVDKRFHIALDALAYVEDITEGKFRADGVTPELIHPLSVTALMMTFHDCLVDPVSSYSASLLHDCVEDLGVSVESVRDRFGASVADPVRLVSKVVHGVKVASLPVHFELMAGCPVASALKGCDRAVNLSTMSLAQFSAERQLRQADETEALVLPMLKSARRRFSRQQPCYENLKFMLQTQVRMIRLQHKALVED